MFEQPFRSALSTAAILAGVLVWLSPALPAADTEGQRENMQLNADNASMGEILQALSSRFSLTYRLPANINRTITGSYRGSLRQVLGRVLDGNDYIVRETEAGLDVVILAPSLITIAPNSQAQQFVDPRPPTIASAAPVTPTSGAVAAAAPPPPLSSFLAGARAGSAETAQR